MYFAFFVLQFLNVLRIPFKCHIFISNRGGNETFTNFMHCIGVIALNKPLFFFTKWKKNLENSGSKCETLSRK